MKKYTILTLTVLSLAISACSKKEPETVQNNENQQQEIALNQLSIGYQKAALKLVVAKQNQFFEQAFPETKIEWKEFPAGPQTLEALSVGAIDFGYTGDVPVIFALAANKPIQYLVAEQSASQSHALLVAPESKIQQVSDLKGKRIGLTKGSSAHYFLSETLKKNGLTWQDIEPIWLTPADGRAALDKKAIEAWAVWEPYVSSTEVEGKARNVFSSDQLPSVYSFYSAQPKFSLEHPTAVAKIAEVLNQTDDWINDHPADAAKILAESTGLTINITEKVISKKYVPNHVSPPNTDIVQAQQKIADSFYELKLLPTQVDVKNTAAAHLNP